MYKAIKEKTWRGLMLLLAALLSLPALAAPIKVTGRVQDTNGDPLIGVTITEKGTQNIAVTDINGSYNITTTTDKPVLVATYMGFKAEEVKVTGTLIDIVLHEDVNTLDELVVSAMTTQKKVSVLGAQSSIKMEDVKAPVANMSSVLAGRVSGVVSVQRTGVPGQDDSDIWIRGISTLTNRNEGPLILVDGIERSFNDLDPEDVETITVLKDAASTAVYGVRGGNGVIIITTKPGQVSKPKFSVDVYHGITSLTKIPKLVNGIDYMNAVNEAMANDGRSQFYSDKFILNTKLANNIPFTAEDLAAYPGYAESVAGDPTINPYLYPNVDWMKELYKNTGYNNRANINIRGGAPNAQYYISLSYYNERGLTKEDPAQYYSSQIDYDRYNFLTNINLKASKTTNVDVGVSGFLSSGNYPHIGLGEIFTHAMTTNPVIYPKVWPNGENPGMSPDNRELDNPWVLLTRRGSQTQHETQVNSNLKVTQDLGFTEWMKGLTARALVAFDVRATQSLHNYFDDSTWRITGGQNTEGVYTADGVYMKDENGDLLGTTPEFIQLREMYNGNPKVDSSADKWVYRTFYFEGAVDYKRIFAKKHTVTGLVLFSLRNYLDANYSGIFNTMPHKQQSLSMRLTYDYMNRYFVEANGGYTGSENFEPGERFGFFPAFAIGWVPSSETWWEPVKEYISFLKFRYSDGTVGNDSSGSRFSYFTKIGSGGEYNNYWRSNGVSGTASYEDYGYKSQWSKIRKRDLGIEVNFFNDDLTFVFDLFKERRTNIFVDRQNISDVAGFDGTVRANVGIVENKGYEASFEYSHTFNKNFWMAVRGNITENEDKVIENAQATPLFPWLDQRGHNVLAEWGWVAEGLFTEDDFQRDANGDLTNRGGRGRLPFRPDHEAENQRLSECHHPTADGPTYQRLHHPQRRW